MEPTPSANTHEQWTDVDGLNAGVCWRLAVDTDYESYLNEY